VQCIVGKKQNRIGIWIWFSYSRNSGIVNYSEMLIPTSSFVPVEKLNWRRLHHRQHGRALWLVLLCKGCRFKSLWLCYYFFTVHKTIWHFGFRGLWVTK